MLRRKTSREIAENTHKPDLSLKPDSFSTKHYLVIENLVTVMKRAKVDPDLINIVRNWRSGGNDADGTIRLLNSYSQSLRK